MMLHRLKFHFSILCILLFSSVINLYAEGVTIERATKVAESFWNQYSTRGTNGNIIFSWDNSVLSPNTRSNSSSQSLFYVFESFEGRGFVIIAADDDVMPILGYSFEDPAPKPDNLPIGMKDWINWISNQISYVKDNKIENENVSQLWTTVSMGNIIVELQTARWNQGDPYNKQCPYDGLERSLTGCVPTATAIVMRYHKWPEYGSGQADSYYTDTNGIYVESRDLNHKYNWDNMPIYDIENQSYTSEEANDISTLMVDIGTAFQVDYSKDATPGSLDISALYEYFDYNPGMFYISRENYSDEIWLQMLKDEINGLRPIIYIGQNDNSGHAFILDGYTDKDYFHVNWGWGGLANGYYTLSNLVPDNRGGYNDNQWACFNLKPNKSSEVEDWITFKSPGILISETNFEQNVKFYFDELWFRNNTAVDFSGSFRGAVTDREGNIKEWITNDLEYTLLSLYGVRFKNVPATITQPICIGDRIRFFYKSEYSDVWNLIKSINQIDCIWEILINDEFYISETTSFTYDKKNGVIILNVKDEVNAQLYSYANEDVSNLLIINGNSISINTQNLSSDTYILKLRKGSDEKVLEFVIK